MICATTFHSLPDDFAARCNRTGKVNSFGWLRYSGFVRHKEPHLDAAGALADLLVFTLNLTGLDILHKIESQDTTW